MLLGHVQSGLRRSYVRWIRPHIPQPIHRQRLKLAWFVWGYGPLLTIKSIPLRDRLKLLIRFLRIDWCVLHAHTPLEIALICRALAERPARPGEVVVEAGCWQGGSSAKFSLIGALLGYRLCIFDSFEGVEAMTAKEVADSFDFSGSYRAAETTLRSNVALYGRIDVCTIRRGWFADTLAAAPVPNPVRLAFIDCDLAKGTDEVLSGVVPSLVQDGWIFSQDFHIKPVRRLLSSPTTWGRFRRGMPAITQFAERLAGIRFL